ncbi:MAG: transglycosylase SLT domain-containing protein [Myxococcota bacterium]|nr:transglycosylase SLT domain-containing protein [Myxococcota bacterium]
MHSSPTPHFSQTQRNRILALVCLSLVLMSGSAIRSTGSTSVAEVEAPIEEVEIAVPMDPFEMSLVTANPSLGSEERGRILNAIDRYSNQYQLDADLVMAVMLVESGARPWAHSPKGAVGLMQVMPHMMRPMDLAGNMATIESNIEAGCFILANNIRRLGLERGISAYFWGSRIRGVAYLNKVLEVRDQVREQRAS